MAAVAAPAPATPGPKAYPLLVFVHGENHENQSFCDAVSRPETTFTRTIPELMNTPILKTTNHQNWLLLQADPPVQLRLWNPVSLQSIHLPPLELDSVESIRHVSLSKNPLEPDCVLFLWVNDEILFCNVNGDDRIWSHGENETGQVDTAVYDDRIQMSDIEVVSQNRLAIRPLKCKAPHNHVLRTRPIEYNSHWVSCCGDVFVIYVSFGGVGHKERAIGEEIVSFNVFKLDSSDMSWKMVDSCPNAAFFISGDQVLACPIASSDSSKLGNRVYMVLEGSKFLCTYHIGEKTLQKSLLGQDFPSTTPYWILIPDVGALEKAEEDYHAFYRLDYREEEEEEEEEDRCFVNDQLSMNDDDDDDYGDDDDHVDVDEEEVTSLNDLPDDILILISSYLSDPIDYLNFRATSKLCRSVGTAKGWRSISRGDEYDSTRASPWLMIPSLVDKGVSTMLDPVSGKNYHLRTSWGYDHSRIAFTLNGWLLMYSDYSSSGENDEVKMKLRLYNPITKCTVNIPESDPLPHFFFLPFSTPDDCIVFGLSVSRPFPSVDFIELSEGSWYSGLLDIGNDENDNWYVNQSHISPVHFDDRFFFFLGDGNMASVIYSEKTLYTRVSNPLKLPCSSFEQRFLVGFGDQLLSVYIGKEWEWLRVFILDESDNVWDEVGDLKNMSVYLSAVSCFVSMAESPELGNRVYLPRFQDGHIVYYSFNTRRFHAGNSLASYHESKEQLYCSWFQPNWNV